MMKSGNPVLSGETYQKWSATSGAAAGVMTVKGTVQKSLALSGLLLVSFFVTWFKVVGDAASMAQVYPWLIGSSLAALGIALFTSFVAKASPFTAPVYALVEGVVLGAISKVLEFKYPGIAFQAAGLTLGIFLAMLLLFTSRTLRATPGLKRFVYVASMGAFLFYLITFSLNVFAGYQVPYIHQSTPIGIIFSLVMIGIASFRLIVNFDLVEEGEAAQAPKFMEWYASFALLVTVVWLYVEVLMLLAKLRGRD